MASEIDELINNISGLRDAIRAGDAKTLRALLKDGSDKKERLNGEYK